MIIAENTAFSLRQKLQRKLHRLSLGFLDSQKRGDIARVAISNPSILILDEAASNIDFRTELLITRAMNAMMKGHTSFIIAHRLYTIRNADSIIFMKDGDVREVGTHEELMRKEGWGNYLMKKYAKGNATEAQVKIPVVIDALPEEEWIR